MNDIGHRKNFMSHSNKMAMTVTKLSVWPGDCSIRVYCYYTCPFVLFSVNLPILGEENLPEIKAQCVCPFLQNVNVSIYTL